MLFERSDQQIRVDSGKLEKQSNYLKRKFFPALISRRKVLA